MLDVLFLVQICIRNPTEKSFVPSTTKKKYPDVPSLSRSSPNPWYKFVRSAKLCRFYIVKKLFWKTEVATSTTESIFFTWRIFAFMETEVATFTTEGTFFEYQLFLGEQQPFPHTSIFVLQMSEI